MIKRIVSTLAVIALVGSTGCATVSMAPAGLPSLKEGGKPDPGVRTTVNVGEVMYEKFRYYSVSGAVVKQTFNHNSGYDRAYVPAGTNLAVTTVDGKSVFCTRTVAYRNIGNAFHLCFSDDDHNGVIDVAYILGPMGIGSWKDDISIPYEMRDQFSDAGGFRYEIIYQGKSGNTIRLSYREYSDNLARPAYQQDLIYDFAGNPTTISFKSARFTIESANNNKITYKLNSGLE